MLHLTEVLDTLVARVATVYECSTDCVTVSYQGHCWGIRVQTPKALTRRTRQYNETFVARESLDDALEEIERRLPLHKI